MRRSAHVHLVIAGLLALLLVGVTTLPAAAAEPTRHVGKERLAFRLVNCLRTGGYVTTAGECRGYGSGRYSRRVPPLKYSRKISNKIAWPWARRTAMTPSSGYCFVGHTLGTSTISSRFRSVGLGAARNGENMGCATYAPRKMVVLIVRMWQREKSYGGSHWRQLKDRRFKSAGTGVAKYRGRSQLVVNFYGALVS